MTPDLEQLRDEIVKAAIAWQDVNEGFYQGAIDSLQTAVDAYKKAIEPDPLVTAVEKELDAYTFQTQRNVFANKRELAERIAEIVRGEQT